MLLQSVDQGDGKLLVDVAVFGDDNQPEILMDAALGPVHSQAQIDEADVSNRGVILQLKDMGEPYHDQVPSFRPRFLAPNSSNVIQEVPDKNISVTAQLIKKLEGIKFGLLVASPIRHRRTDATNHPVWSTCSQPDEANKAGNSLD